MSSHLNNFFTLLITSMATVRNDEIAIDVFVLGTSTSGNY
jgi:hypothetical protein